MSDLPSPSTATLLELESAFDTPARNLTKSRGKNIHRYVSAKTGKKNHGRIFFRMCRLLSF